MQNNFVSCTTTAAHSHRRGRIISILLALMLTLAGITTSTTATPAQAAPAPKSSTLSLSTSDTIATAIAVGSGHTCALTSNGGIKCWGGNSYGQLGDGTTNYSRPTPVDVTGLSSGITAIAVGASHTCALTSGGGIKCWGYNYYGQLGDGATASRATPVAVSGLSSGVTTIAAGGSHTCALTNSGAVLCWGSNDYGQLGDNSTTNRTTPVAVSGLSSGVTAIAAGGSHTCALMTDGGIKCWGRNNYGQLGDNSTTQSNTPVAVSGLSSGVTAIAAGGSHTCALITDDGIKCWGRNNYGQLGDNSTTQSNTPVDVSGISNGVSAIAAGGSHACALTSDGGIKCWGSNGAGQLGDNSTTQSNTPVDVSGLSNGVSAIATGGGHTCALLSDGGIKCWGYNNYGQLGDGSYGALQTKPVATTGLSSGVTALTAAASHTCALTSEGGVNCWGYNNRGQLGDDSTTNRTTPVDVRGLSTGVTSIAAGGTHGCAVTSDGGIKCWGDNTYGQLGDGSTNWRPTPLAVTGLSTGITALAAGTSHTCAVTSGGGALCWGRNSFGQLGNNAITDRYTPVDVSGLSSGVTALAAGESHTCALTNDGVQCWGNNIYGQLGDGSTNSRRTPVAVTGLSSSITALATGGKHTCALTSEGGVQCWGYNLRGQLGNGSTAQSTTPMTVTGLSSGVIAIAAGTDHTCALTSTGGIKCWGDNNKGHLGNLSTTQSTTPVDVTDFSNGLTTLTAGAGHTCALSSIGVQCWGNSYYGQLGNGATDVNRSMPVAVEGFYQTVVPVPNLAVADANLDASSGKINVPVRFNSDGAAIASLGFSLDYQESCLSFDASDSNSDGVPDTIAGLPAGFAASIRHDANDNDGELDVSLWDDSDPIGTLSDSTLLTMTLSVANSCVTTDGSTVDVAINFATDPAVSFGDANGEDVNGSATDGTLTLAFNTAPTALALSNSTVNENAASSTAVGTLTTTDLNAGDTHTYSLVTGTGDTDNASFTIVGDSLQTAAVFDFETKSSYSVRIRTTDSNGAFFEQPFTISVNDLYEPPTTIDISQPGGGDDGDPNTLDINENGAAGSTVAIFAASNADNTITYTYELVAGEGDTDNGSFTIVQSINSAGLMAYQSANSGNYELQTTVPLDAEKPDGYSIRVEITDSQGNSFAEPLVITVNNINEAPVAVDDPDDLSANVVVGGATQTLAVLANDSDPEDDPLTVASLTQPAAGSATNNGTDLTVTVPNANGTTTFTYQASDGALNSADATVTVNYVKDDLRGDCNANGSVTAADFIATVLEIFDASEDPRVGTNPAWWSIYAGGYAGSPLGCDANASQNGTNNDVDSVTIADVICTVNVFFGNPSCTAPNLVAASTTATATLSAPQTQTAQAGTATTVALRLETAGNDVAAAAFVLVLDPQLVGFYSTDSDGDGVPDAITVNAPASMSRSVTWDAARNRLEVALYGVALPLPTLTDGVLVTVTLDVAADAPAGSTPLMLEQVSLGDSEGNDLAVTAVDGVLTITEGREPANKLFLPIVTR